MAVGRIAFLGSGETSHAGGALFERLAARLPRPLQVAILETPAGFEPNSPRVAGRVAEFIASRLQCFPADTHVVPARRRGTAFSPDDPETISPLFTADLIFMGPGSPTYAIRQLQGSLAWEVLRARHRLGATLAFASSAAIAVGAWALPVYEIYKVGQEVSAVPGLNLLADFGLECSFIPHWNNSDGGEELDTGRCFVGQERFATWFQGIPSSNTTVGLDEHTWLILDLAGQSCEIGGVGSVFVVRGTETHQLREGTYPSLSNLGVFRDPVPLEAGISPSTWQLASNASRKLEDEPPLEIQQMAAECAEARSRRDWSASDSLREQMRRHGWQVQETRSGKIVLKRERRE